MKTSILAQVSALVGGVGSHVFNHPSPTHDLLSKKSRMKAFGPATVVYGREQYSRSVQDYEAPPPCAYTVGWIDSAGDGCDWYAVNDELGCPTYGYSYDGGMGVAADNCCHCAGTSEDDTTPATTTTYSTSAIEVDNTTAPADDTTVATTTTTSTSAPEVDDPCIICPNGATYGFDDVKPNVVAGDARTCVELIQVSTTIEIGTEFCAYSEIAEVSCCFAEPEIPCIICPDGVTAPGGDDYVPDYVGNTATCSELIQSAKQFKFGSDACRFFDVDATYCCPPGGNPTPTPMPVAVRSSGGHIGKVVGMAIAGVSVFSFMALAIYYLRRMASNANSPQKNTAGSDIPMAVVVNMDPETAEAPLSKGNPLRPPYAPHASTPPPYAPHASAPPLE